MSAVLRALGLALVAALLAFGPAHAVKPDEVLKDPVQEQRARKLSGELRCLVCQNQSIDDSDAPLARDLRVLVREQIVQGRNDTQIMDYLVARYGEFVLLRPRFTAGTALLWLSPLLIFGVGGLFIFVVARRKRGLQASVAVPPLSAAEQDALQRRLQP